MDYTHTNRTVVFIGISLLMLMGIALTGYAQVPPFDPIHIVASGPGFNNPHQKTINHVEVPGLVVTPMTSTAAAALTIRDIQIADPQDRMYVLSSAFGLVEKIEVFNLHTKAFIKNMPPAMINGVDTVGMAVSPNGNRLAVVGTEYVSGNDLYFVIDTQTDQFISTGILGVGTDLTEVDWTADSSKIFIKNGSTDVAVIDVVPNTVTLLPTPGSAFSVTPTGNNVAWAYENPTTMQHFIRVYSALTPGSFTDHATGNGALLMAASPDGTKVAGYHGPAVFGQSTEIRSIFTGGSCTFFPGVSNVVRGMEYGSNGNLYIQTRIVGGSAGTIQIINPLTCQSTQTFTLTGGQINTLGFTLTEDNKYIYFHSTGNPPKLYSLKLSNGVISEVSVPFAPLFRDMTKYTP